MDQSVTLSTTPLYDNEDENSSLIGFKTIRTESSKQIVTTYDVDGTPVGDPVETPLYKTVELSALSETFQSAWGQIKDNLGADFSGELKFQEDGGLTSVLNSSDQLLGYVKSSTGSVSINDTREVGENFVDLTIVETTDEYKVLDVNYAELGSSGMRQRVVVEENGVALAAEVPDENISFVTFFSSESNYSSEEWENLNPDVKEVTWNDVKNIQNTVNTTTTVVDGNSYRLNEAVASSSTEEFRFLDSSTTLLGTQEQRNGITEVRDTSGNMLLRKVDLETSFSFEAMASSVGPEWSKAWDAIADFIPDEFKPSNDISNLKFSYDEWENIMVFSPDGEMVGRINTWDNEDVQNRSWRGDYQINTNKNFEFNDADFNQIARYEVGNNYASSDGVKKDGNLESSHENISYRASKYIYDAQENIVSLNTNIAWKDIESSYGLTNEYAALLFDNGWSNDVDQVSIGTNTWKNYQYDDDGNATLDADGNATFDEEKSERIEYFNIRSEDEGGWREFLGVKEVRDGFIEVRDENWNEIARIVDTDSAMDFEAISSKYVGFANAWGQVGDFLPTEMAIETKDSDTGAVTALTNALKFTADDYNIFVFGEDGKMLSQVNYWSNDGENNEWTNYYYDGQENIELTISRSDYQYNFHDADWNSYAHAGGSANYITKVDGTTLSKQLLHEEGSNYGYRVSKDEYVDANGGGEVGLAAWSALDPNVLDDISWDAVNEIKLNNNVWSAVDNIYRNSDDLWSDNNEQTEYFVVADNAPDERVGLTEIRDGFIEIRDGNWNLIARKVDTTDPSTVKTFAQVVGNAKYGSDFADAWEAIKQYLPEAFKPSVDGDADYKNLKFSYGNYDDIMVFSPDGEMVGRINTWDNEYVQDRSWRGDYQINTNKSFEFNDADFNQIARYEVGNNYASSDGKAADGNIEGSHNNISYTVSKLDVGEDNWASLKAEHDLATLMDAGDVERVLENGWDVDVDYISVGTNTWKNYQYDDDGNATLDADGNATFDEEKSERIEYFNIRSEDEGGWREFLGVKEVRDGFIEVRDENWNEIARIVDTDSAMDFEAISSKYVGFANAWGQVGDFLPTEMAIETKDSDTGAVTALTNALKFTADDYNIFVFGEDGKMLSQVNYWSNDGENNEWTNYYYDGQENIELTISRSDYQYNFHDADWNSYAHAGGSANYITKVDGTTLSKQLLHEEGSNYGYRVSKDEYVDANGGGEVGLAAWSALDPNVPDDISWDAVNEIQLNNNVWSAVDNIYRNSDDLWSDNNEQTEYFVVADNAPDERVGLTEIRDGFIEIRDGNWNLIARKVDTTDPSTVKTFAQVVGNAKYGSDFVDAWEAIKQYLPEAFKPSVDGDADYKNLKFSYGNYDDIMVFSPDGEMVGRINTWDNEYVQDRSWRGDYQINTNKSFEFNDADFNQIARYEVGNNYASSDGKAADGNIEGSHNNISYTVSKLDVGEDNWASLKAEHDLATLMDAGDVERVLENGWDVDVDYISVGTNTWKNYQYDDDGNATLDADGNATFDEEKSERIEYFNIRSEDEGGWREFLGVKEVRDGFIEVRDENWNEIARIVDTDSAMDFEAISSKYVGFANAWGQVGDFLPTEMAIETKDSDTGAVTALTNALKFTADDYNIFVFGEDGKMLSQVNYWSNDGENNEWTNYYYDGQENIELTISRSDYQYNFHDADWNSYAHAGGSANYITKVDGTTLSKQLLHEEGSNYGYRVSKDEYVDANGGGEVGLAAWSALDPNVPDDISWDAVNEIQLNNNVWSAVDNIYRNSDDLWSDNNEQTEYFVVADNAPDERVGLTEIRDGFIEIRDGNWNLIARKVDTTDPSTVKTFAQVVGNAKYGSDFADAWEAIKQYLPEAFKPSVDGDADYKNLKFSYGNYDDIMVFSPDGEMVGRINTWDNEYVQDRSWRGDYQINTNKSFEFNDADFNQIARYEVGNNYASSDGKAADGNIEGSHNNISYTVSKLDVGEDNWASLKAEHDLATLMDAGDVERVLENGWDVDVDYISVGTNTWKNYQYDDDGNATLDADGNATFDEEKSERIEYFNIRSEDEGGWREFLGVKEVRDGFIEVRDENWNEIARIVDTDSAMDFEAISSKYVGFANAWGQVGDFLPTEMAIETKDSDTGAVTALTNALKFTADDYNIFVFGEDGKMLSVINYWANENTWFSGAAQFVEYDSNFQFKDADYNMLAEHGQRNKFVLSEGAEQLDKTSLNTSYTIDKSDLSETDWNDIEPDFTAMNDPSLAPFDWNNIGKVSFRTNSYETFENVERSDSETYTGGSEELEFRHAEGHRLGIIETSGNLVSVSDGNRILIDSYLSGSAQGLPLAAVMNATNEDFLKYFDNEIRTALPDLDNYEMIESSDGPAYLLNASKIVGLIYLDTGVDNYGNAYFSYDIRDIDQNELFSAGGYQNLNDLVAPFEPSGIYVSKYENKDLMTTSEWQTVTQNLDYAIEDSAFDWDNVKIVRTKYNREDNNENNKDDPLQSYKITFVAEDEYGNDVWDYFEIRNENGIKTVNKFGNGNWKAIKKEITDDSQFGVLSEDEGGKEFSYLIESLYSEAPDQLDDMFEDFEALTFKFHSESDLVAVHDGEDNLIGIGSTWEEFDDEELSFGLTINFINLDDEIEFGSSLTLDDERNPNLAEWHQVWFAKNYSIENYGDTDWDNLLDTFVPNIDGLASKDVGVIQDQLNFSADTSGDGFSEKTIVRFVPIIEEDESGFEFDWNYSHNYRMVTENNIEKVYLGQSLLSSTVDFTNLSKIDDLESFNQTLVNTLTRLEIDLESNFDFYKEEGSTDFFAMTKGTTDAIFKFEDHAENWTSANNPSVVAYEIYSTKSDHDYVGWLWQSTPDYEDSILDVTGTMYGSHFINISPESLSNPQLNLITEIGEPSFANYTINELDAFGLGQRILYNQDDEKTDDIIVVQHQLDDVKDNWVGRIYFNTLDDTISESSFNNRKNLPEELELAPRPSNAELKLLQSSFIDSAFDAWATYDPNVQPTETSLGNLSEFSSSAHNIITETEYLSKLISKMSVTELNGGDARLKLGKEDDIQITLKNMSAAWDYDDDDTIAGYDIIDELTGSELGWIWQSKPYDYGVAEEAMLTTSYSFLLKGILIDNMSEIVINNFDAIGTSSTATTYTIDEVIYFDIRRDVHKNDDQETIADLYRVSHYGENGLLGKVMLDVKSGKQRHVDEFDDGVMLSSSLSGSNLSTTTNFFESLFEGTIVSLPQILIGDIGLGKLSEIDLSIDYDSFVDESYTDEVSGLNTFKSAGTELLGEISSVKLEDDSSYMIASNAFDDSLNESWSSKTFDFETSSQGNFASSGYTASLSDKADGQTGNMIDGATGTLVIDDAISVTLFNIADEAGDGGNNGDDPGIASHIGNDADRGFNITTSGNNYLEVLPGNKASGGVLVSFDDFMAPVYGVNFSLMGVEDTKREILIDVHLSDGTIYREVADTHTQNTGGYQYYGYSLNDTYSQTSSIEGFVLYEPYDGEGSGSRDIFAIDDIEIVYGTEYESLHSIDPTQNYENFVGTNFTYISELSEPTFMSRFVSDRIELNLNNVTTLEEAAELAGESLVNYKETKEDFTFNVAVINEDAIIDVYDFESSNLGNFALHDYSASSKEVLTSQSGDMTNGASGTLIFESGLSVTLFNTGNDIEADEPGIADNSGNSTDRGFNITTKGSQYLEILPSETGPGGALFNFDELDTPVLGFGFDLMGIEDQKRDIFIDIHLSDGSVYREVSEEHAEGSGGVQYYSYLVDQALSNGISISGVMLYQEYVENTHTKEDRDIFSVDDLQLVVVDYSGDVSSGDILTSSVDL